MGNESTPWLGYFALGTIWNMVVLTIMGANGSGGLSWYAGLGGGLLFGGMMTVLGETVLRSADIAIRRQNGLLAYLSPSWWFRVMFSLVPGLIARSARSPVSRESSAATDRFLDATRGHRVVATRRHDRTYSVGDQVVLEGRSFLIEAVDAGSGGGLDYTVAPVR